jgi:single-strand DNA-binding protein
MANPSITVKGNVASDPEIRQLANSKVLKMRVITNDAYKDDSGQWQNKDTSGWTIEAWGDLAERAYDILKKGDSVVLMGVIKERNFEDKDGNKRYVVEIKASSIALDLISVSNRKPKATVVNSQDDLWEDLAGNVV